MDMHPDNKNVSEVLSRIREAEQHKDQDLSALKTLASTDPDEARSILGMKKYKPKSQPGWLFIVVVMCGLLAPIYGVFYLARYEVYPRLFPEMVNIENSKGLRNISSYKCEPIGGARKIKRICLHRIGMFDKSGFVIVQIGNKYHSYCGVPIDVVNGWIASPYTDKYYETQIRGNENFECLS